MRSRVLHLYIAAMCIAALMALALIDWRPLLDLPRDSLGGLGLLVGIAMLSEGLAIRLDVGKRTSSSSILFIPLLASVQLFGPAAAVALMVVTGPFGDFVRRKPPIKALFNSAQGIVATSIAGLAFALSGGTALELTVSSGQAVADAGQLIPFGAFALVFLAVNHVAVALVIALSQQLRFVDVLGDALGRSGASLQDLLISPIAIVVAFMYVSLKVIGIIIVLLPLLFVRHAYVNMSRLREANEDLLKALIKAIETRDPYTSGHSLRVSHLARRIAERLGLPRRTLEQIEHAALLHDIGKIEAVYTGILMKPAALSREERAIIESHVTKGEELLRNLSSVPEGVIRSVRHHHEREDGSGYPDGLRGLEIPLGAKIIAVCDAIDAMLSDRPYRSALTMPVVVEQLAEHAGAQFDPDIVDAVLGSDVLTDYAETMRILRMDVGVGQTVPAPIRSFAKQRPFRPGVAPAGGH